MELDIIYNRDCLEGLKELPDESIDLLVTDCPYRLIGGGVSTSDNAMHGILGRGAKKSIAEKWIKNEKQHELAKSGKLFDNNDIEFSQWLPEVYRVLKPKTHAYIMINGRNLKELQQEAENVGFKFQNLLVWEKNNSVSNKFYMLQSEFILMLRKGGERWINEMGTSNIIKCPNIIGNKNHPTEKPVPLMEVLIRNSSNPEDIVLDPFAGSGSTLLAARKLNRHFIGYEIDKEYYDVINQRLANDNEQMVLF